jgi:hypothetical protein
MITKGLGVGLLLYVLIVMVIHNNGYLLSSLTYFLISLACIILGELVYPQDK